MPRTAMFEQLEGRQLLSGNINAVLGPDTISIIGDALGNGVTLTYDGTFFGIIPDATTSLNHNAPGMGFFYKPSLPLRKLNVNMGGGADNVIIAPAVVGGG